MLQSRPIIILLLLALVITATAGRARADGGGVALVGANSDGFVSAYEPDTPLSGTKLLYNDDHIFDGQQSWCPANMHYPLLRFDLGTIAFDVDKARLKLFPSVGGSTPPPFYFALHANDWSESTLTWNNAPAITDVGLQLGAPAVDASGYWTWTDTLGLADGYGLADWLAPRAGEVVTLSLFLPLPAGCLYQPEQPPVNTVDYSFVDRSAGPGPMLELADAATPLPDPVPLAVGLRSGSATGDGIGRITWLTAAALTAATLLAWAHHHRAVPLWRRRRPD